MTPREIGGGKIAAIDRATRPAGEGVSFPCRPVAGEFVAEEVIKEFQKAGGVENRGFDCSRGEGAGLAPQATERHGCYS